MDPNEALGRLRRRIPSLRDHYDPRVSEVAELFEALDGWMTRGGFPPDAWDGERHYYGGGE